MIELLQQRLSRYTIDGAEQQEQALKEMLQELTLYALCLLYTSPSPRDGLLSRMPSSA